MTYYLNYEPSKKFRTFFFRTYVDPLPIIQDLKGLNHYAYIKHDRDVLSDGTTKKPHFHVVVTFTNPRYETAVGDIILAHIPIEQQNTQCFALSHTDQSYDDKSIRYAIRYLIHADDDTKVKYDRSEVYTDYDGYIDKYLNMSTVEVKTENRERENSQFIFDLFALSPIELGFKYGRDFIKNYRAYLEYKTVVQNNHGVTNEYIVQTLFKCYKGEELSGEDLLTLECSKAESSEIANPYDYDSDGRNILYERIRELESENELLKAKYNGYYLQYELLRKKKIPEEEKKDALKWKDNTYEPPSW